ncbi:MAG: DUF2523 domain-containing protein [Polaromonas sp.]|nr:DUF2523 domain-containing protein [Polaromonas sp.]
MNWASFLITLAGPLALRVLTAVGLGTVTFTGLTIAIQSLIDSAVTNWASLPGDVLGLAGVAGLPQSIGIICGAMVARAGMWAAVSATRFVMGK